MVSTADSSDERALDALCTQLERLAIELRATAPEQLAALDGFAHSEQQTALALARCVDQRAAVCAWRIIAACARSWWIRGRAAAHRAEVDAALTLEADATAALVGAAQGGGELDYARADYSRAATRFERAKHTATRVGDLLGSAHADNWLGMVDRECGRLHQAQLRHERALSGYAALDHAWGRAHALSNLGVVAFRHGALDEARVLHHEALGLRRALDDLHGISSSLGNLALLHRGAGELEHARELYLESLAARVRLRDDWGVAGSRVCLASVALGLAALDEARDQLQRALDGFLAVEDALGLAECAEVTVELCAATDEGASAKLALSLATRLRRSLGAPAPAQQHARLLALVGEASFLPVTELEPLSARTIHEQLRSFIDPPASANH